MVIASQVRNRGRTACGKNATQGIGNFAEVNVSAFHGCKHRAEDKQCWEERKDGGVGRTLGNGEGVVLESPPEREAKQAPETRQGGTQHKAPWTRLMGGG